MPLTNQKIKHLQYKAKCWKQKRLKANVSISVVENLPVNISNPNPKSIILLFDKSFICWADESWKNIVAVVKFHPFSTMDTSLKSQYQLLSQHLMAQSTYQCITAKKKKKNLLNCLQLTGRESNGAHW
ncbi:hypothetical protein VP01_3376g2 [Puccinia sorghi]|uniref:Uncharacterized protein n=1 Tax=Puccinia sorghi TaxID=27349 RepID=A0A0L6UWS6_9BASI|nr:hypothetical protein VP01_3376g2 [Puccinia sorghi]